MMAVHATAQPAKRKAEQKAAATTSGAISTRAQISFPVQTRMAEDVVWRRDIYRELDLHDDANASLYYPVEPMGNQVNLFTYIFKLMMTGNIKAYEYPLTISRRASTTTRPQPPSTPKCWRCAPS